VAKDKDEARSEGFARGVKGKSAAGVTQGWTDDEAATVSRNEGWVAGKRKRAQVEAAKAKEKKSRK
jgi:hypothetical protein